ncbi:non-ribosomal peptide synthetase [Paenibacillus tarimensis]|uniref:non-ribosomal peptide synthetase n=1 Tax=Paenibacillus tarimensis TaxID=416012 RepID=UPI001F19D049|nr:non-ribosomal peptide synthetase [Paenibacillus tarimensis]MCF2945521.1 amino acid adenylation domain-containing protein [Paenibacillus tarimensis]
MAKHRGTRLPLSSAQYGMWYSQELDPANPIFNTGEYTEISGELDIVSLEAAIVQTIRQVDSLRVTFEDASDGIYQILYGAVSIPVSVVDLSSEPDPHQAAMTWMNNDMQRAVSLLQDSLFTQAIIRIGPECHYWYQRIHHIAIDGFGLSLISKSVADTYTAIRSGSKSKTRFGSLHAILQEEQEYRLSDSYKLDREYWLDKLSTMKEIAGFHTYQPREDNRVNSMIRETRYLSRSNAEALKNIAREFNVNWSDLLIAVTAVYLYRYTGSPSIVLGIPMMRRLGSVSIRVPALVMNLLPLYLNIQPEDSLLQIIKNIAYEMKHIRKHQHYRHEEMRRDLKLVGTDKKLFGPVINIMPFDYHLDFAGNPGVTHNLSSGPVETLSINVYDRSGQQGLRIDMDGNAGLYDQDELRTHANRWNQLVKSIITCDLHKPVSSFPYLLAEEQLLLFSEQHQTNHQEACPDRGEYAAYCRSVAADGSSTLNMPTDLSVNSSTNEDSRLVPVNSSYCFVLDTGTTARLQKLAQYYQVSLRILMLTLYTVMLSKYSNQTNIRVGTIIGERRLTDQPDVPRASDTPLMIRNKPAGDKTFYQLLCETTVILLEAYKNRDCHNQLAPGSSEVNERQHALFENMFIYSFAEKLDRALFVFMVEENNEELHVTIHYPASCYQPEMIARMSAHYSHITRQVLDNPNVFLHELVMITEAERKQILEEFQPKRNDLPHEKTIHERFQEQVLQFPHKTAIQCGDCKVTYDELNKRANQLARGLQAEGVRPGHLVGILSERSVDMMAGILAILKAGGAYVPIDPAYPDQRIQHILSDSRASHILVQASHYNRIKNSKPIILDSQQWVQEDHSNLENEVSSRDLAYVLYTSGSTGAPKGVMIEHRSVLNFLQTLETRSPLSAQDVLLQKTSVAFDASVWELFWWMMKGASLCLLETGGEKDAGVIIDAVQKHQVTHLEFVPSMLQVFVDYVETFAQADRLASLKYVSVGGEVLSARLAEQFYRSLTIPNQTLLYNTYGPTESTVEVTSFLYTGGSSLEKIPIGKPNLNTAIYILNEHKQLQPIGIPGELCIAGEGLARGYLNMDELTAARFVDNPFVPGERMYRSGDIARWLPDGNIEYIGRVDRQVKIRGYRIELGEIESAFYQIQEVKQAVVNAQTELNGDTALCAYFTASARLPVHQIRVSLSNSLPDYMIPSTIIQLESMPLSPSGKIDLSAQQRPERPPQGVTGATAPASPQHLKLSRIWEEVLGLGQISVTDHFFEIGGHSLKASRLITCIHRDFNVLLTVKDIFEHPIFRDMLGCIEQKNADEYVSIPAVSEKAYYPVSSSQKRMYILDQLSGSNRAYNMPLVMSFEGRIDEERLEQSLQAIVGRHESFRTSFEVVEGELVQIIHDKVDFTMDHERAEEEQTADIIQAFIQPFELDAAPLFRAKLVALTTGKHVLLMDMHHIISDGVSMNVFMREWAMLYKGELLAPLRIQYKDYTYWEYSQLLQDKLDNQKTYWLEAFSGELPVLQLPTDYIRPREQCFDGGFVNFVLSEDQTAGLKRLAGQTHTTLYMILLAVYNVLLARYSGQSDIIVGSLSAGRQHTDLESIIGLFIRTLAMRNYPQRDKSFKAFLQEVKETSIGAFENQDFPVEELIHQVVTNHDPSRNKLFDAMFIYQNMMEPVEGSLNVYFDDCKVESFEMIDLVSRYDLTLEALEQDGEVHCELIYAAALFKPETIERMAKHFIQLVDGIIEAPDKAIGCLEMVTEEEKRILLEEFNNKTIEYPTDTMIHQMFEDQVERTPEHIAVVFGENTLTYHELNVRANQLARKLQANGVKQGQPVGIIVERSVEMVISLLAVLKAGGAYVPIDPEYPYERIHYMLEDSACSILLIHQHLQERIPSEHACLYVDADEAYTGDGSNLDCTGGSKQLAYIIYTSGTTGKPKGVMIEHQQVAAIAEGWKHVYRLDNGSFKLLQLASFSFDVFTGDFVRSLLHGGELIICPDDSRRDVRRIAWLIHHHQIHILESTPSLVIPLMDHIYQEYNSIDSLQTIIIGSDQYSPEALDRVVKRFGSKLRIINSYGVTETCIDASYYEYSSPPGNQGGLIGQPYPNVNLYILNEDCLLQPAGVLGELFIGGEVVGRGYLNRPDLTGERFIMNPYKPGERLYRTGDLAKWSTDGNITFVGRVDHQVKIRGNRIEIGEVESAIRRIELVREVVVTAYSNFQNVQSLCAYYVADKELTSKQIGEILAASLPSYMLPSYYVQLECLPLSPNGKIDRKALPTPTSQIDARVEYSAPITPVQELLAEVWQTVLQVDRVGTADHFFELGGDSIKVIQAASMLAESGYEVEVKALFNYPTIAELCEHIHPAAGVLRDEN